MADGDIVRSGDVAAVPIGTPKEIVFRRSNDVRRVPYRTGDTILDTALLRGISLESYCRLGGCSTCRVRVLKGQVMLRRNNILEPEELAEGYALACQAVPQSGTLEIELP